MDKFEYELKVEQIEKLIVREDYSTAKKIADTMEWKKEKDSKLLARVAQLYVIAGDYEKSMTIYSYALKVSSRGVLILEKMTELALIYGELDLALELCEEYRARGAYEADYNMFRFQISEARGEDYEKRIPFLENYVRDELDEDALYQLALLYEKVGRTDDCVKVCDYLIDFFCSGETVREAINLKQKYAPLEYYQERKAYEPEYYDEVYRKYVEAHTVVRQEKTAKPEKPVTAEKKQEDPRKLFEDAISAGDIRQTEQIREDTVMEEQASNLARQISEIVDEEKEKKNEESIRAGWNDLMTQINLSAAVKGIKEEEVNEAGETAKAGEAEEIAKTGENAKAEENAEAEAAEETAVAEETNENVEATEAEETEETEEASETEESAEAEEAKETEEPEETKEAAKVVETVETAEAEETEEASETEKSEETVESEESAEAEAAGETEETAEAEEAGETEEPEEAKEAAEAVETVEAAEADEPTETEESAESEETEETKEAANPVEVEETKATEETVDAAEAEETVETAEAEAAEEKSLNLSPEDDMEEVGEKDGLRPARRKVALDLSELDVVAPEGSFRVACADSSLGEKYALELVRLVPDEYRCEHVARVSAKRLNEANFQYVAEQLDNDVLMVTEAGQLCNAALDNLYAWMKKSLENRVAFIDTEDGLEKLETRKPKLMNRLTGFYSYAPKDTEYWMELVSGYADENGCVLADDALKLFEDYLDDKKENGDVVLGVNLKDALLDAMHEASRITLGNLVSAILSEKYDEDGLLILRDRHFA